MKKIIIVILIIFFPIIINAECNYNKLNEYNKLSSNIDYEVTRNSSSHKYSVKLINVYNNIYAKYNGKNYVSNSSNEIILDNVSEGEKLDIGLYAPLEDCEGYLRTINISTEYYNRMYNDSRCIKYRSVLNICKYEYLSYQTNESLLLSAIKNYENSYKEEEVVVEEEKEPTILENMKEFVTNWGIQILLVILSSGITISIFKVKYRKVKHGI